MAIGVILVVRCNQSYRTPGSAMRVSRGVGREPGSSQFRRDRVVRRECIWRGIIDFAAQS